MAYLPAGPEQYEDLQGFFSFFGKAAKAIGKVVGSAIGGGTQKLEITVGGKPLSQVLQEAAQQGVTVSSGPPQPTFDQAAAAAAGRAARGLEQIPTWAWIAGGGAVALLLLSSKQRRRS